jgi:hypothetical protein
MCGHHRQLEPRRQLHGGHHMALVFGPLGALQLQVKAVGEQAPEIQRAFDGAGAVALQQRLAHGAALRARQRDQAFIEFLEPFELDHRLVAHHVFGPGAREDFGEVEVTLAVLHQQQQPGGGRAGVLAGHLHPDVGAYQGFDARAAGFLVELDGAEEVAQVGDGQRRLPVRGRGGHDFIDAVGAVDDGKFGVEAQMNKHKGHFRAGSVR